MPIFGKARPNLIEFNLTIALDAANHRRTSIRSAKDYATKSRMLRSFYLSTLFAKQERNKIFPLKNY